MPNGFYKTIYKQENFRHLDGKNMLHPKNGWYRLEVYMGGPTKL